MLRRKGRRRTFSMTFSVEGTDGFSTGILGYALYISGNGYHSHVKIYKIVTIMILDHFGEESRK